MITANFTSGDISITTAALWQFDTGQQLRVSGVTGIDGDTEVHFECKPTGAAIVKKGEYADSKLTVDIPNAFLEYADGTPGKVWVYPRASGAQAQTVREILIPVNRRERPADYVSSADPNDRAAVAAALYAAGEIDAAKGNNYQTLREAVLDQSLYHYETTESYVAETLADVAAHNGKYMRLNNGAVSEGTNEQFSPYYTDHIGVEPGERLKISAKYGAQCPLIVCYDSEKTAMAAETANYLSGNSSLTVVTDMTVIIPDGVSFITVNTMDKTANPPAVKRRVISTVTMDEKLRRLEQAMQTTELTGKRLLTAGDSLMYGDGNNGSSVGEYLRDKYGMTLTKNAVTGATLAVRDGRTDSIYERMTALSGDYDYIVFDGGINDNSEKSKNDLTPKAPTGKVTGSFDPEAQDDSIDVSTTVGALEAICRFLVLNYPDAKKLFVISHELTLPTGLLRNSTYLSRMAECIKALEKWGIPYVDMTKTQLKIVGGNSQTKYFHSGDRTHPNAAGYAIYCKEVEKALLYRI